MIFFIYFFAGFVQTLPLPERDFQLHDATSPFIKQFEKFFEIRKIQFDNGAKKNFLNFEQFFKDDFDSFHEIDKTRDEEVMIFLEVDLEYDKSIHEKLKDFALPPHHYKISEAALSEKEKFLKKRQNYGRTKNSSPASKLNEKSKLCLTLLEKSKYIISFEFLLLLSELGITVKK